MKYPKTSEKQGTLASPAGGSRQGFVQSWSTSKRARTCIAILTLTVFYTVIRLMQLDQLVTVDEPWWLGQSANFYRALRTGDLVHTYQSAHPGVLTMWAGAAAILIKAPDYFKLVPHNLDNVVSIESVLRQNHIDPLDLMVAAKVSKVIMQGVFFGIAMIYLTRLVSIGTTILTGLLIVFDPFLSGLDSAFHVDGLFTIVSFTAILSIVYASTSFRLDAGGTPGVWHWAIAGFFCACAWLTRASGLALVGVVGLALTLALISEWRRRQVKFVPLLEQLLLRGCAWLGAAITTTILLLPALLVAPRETLQNLWDWTANAATEGHDKPTFFLGEIIHGDPGWSFYPVAIAWRTTPVEWLGVIAFAILTPLLVRRRLLSRTTVMLIVVAIVFAIGHVAGMSTGAKKFDRYALPVFPVIDLFAAIGFAAAISLLWNSRLRFSKSLAIASVTAIVMAQAAMTSIVLPYRLDFFNPLLGGPSRAQEVLQMGWGQGGIEVVNYINSQIDDGQPVVLQISAAPRSFSYFLPDNPDIHIRSFGMSTPAGWYETDYYVAGIQETQRDMAPIYHIMRRYEPVKTVDIGGVPYFEIFTPRSLPLPDDLQASTGCDTTFGESLRLMQIIGRGQNVDLYWQTVGSLLPGSAEISVEFVAPDDSSKSAIGILVPAQDGVMSRVRLDFPFADSGTPLSDYQMVISVTDTSSGALLTATTPWNGGASLHQATQSECYYAPPPSP